MAIGELRKSSFPKILLAWLAKELDFFLLWEPLKGLMGKVA
jgi:hypothetical protein